MPNTANMTPKAGTVSRIGLEPNRRINVIGDPSGFTRLRTERLIEAS
jgi:hypothetical protein